MMSLISTSKSWVNLFPDYPLADNRQLVVMTSPQTIYSFIIKTTLTKKIYIISQEMITNIIKVILAPSRDRIKLITLMLIIA